MKRYMFDCKGCPCECRIALKDTMAVPHLCPSRGFQPDWQRTGEFEQYEEAPGEIDALKVLNESLRDKYRRLAEIHEGQQKEIINLGRRYHRLVDWIAALLALGTSGLENITGGKEGEQ